MHGMQEVTGSIPVISTRKKSTAQECAVLFCCVCPAMQLLNSCWTFAESYGIILSAIAGIVHRLVYQPSKLRRWVRFPLPAPNRKDAGSQRISVFLYPLAPLLAPLRILKGKKPLQNPKRKEPGGCLSAASRLEFFFSPRCARQDTLSIQRLHLQGPSRNHHH